jgi:hypothetical protein
VQLCRRRASHSHPLPRPRLRPRPRPGAPSSPQSTKPSRPLAWPPRPRAPGRARGEAPRREPRSQPLSSLAHSAHGSRQRAGGTAGRADRRRAATHRRRWAPCATPARGQLGTRGGDSSGHRRSSRRTEGLHWLKQQTLPSLPLPTPPPSPPPGKKKKEKKGERGERVLGSSCWKVSAKPPPSAAVPPKSSPSPDEAARASYTNSQRMLGRWLPGLGPSGCFLSLSPTVSPQMDVSPL